MISGNTVSVATLIAELQSVLKDQTGRWRRVSELLNQADVEFGFGTDEMKQILDQTDIFTSILGIFALIVNYCIQGQ
jgi:hypothetical protein